MCLMSEGEDGTRADEQPTLTVGVRNITIASGRRKGPSAGLSISRASSSVVSLKVPEPAAVLGFARYRGRSNGYFSIIKVWKETKLTKGKEVGRVQWSSLESLIFACQKRGGKTG